MRNLDLDVVRYAEHRPERLLTNVPSFGSREVQWIVRGKGTATVRYEAVKAADRELKISVK